MLINEISWNYWNRFLSSEKILDNDYFVKYLDTTEEWIKSRTGISERRKQMLEWLHQILVQ
jgi:3-oxoacyl-[acyl-carrier-protein] synthase III